MYFRFRNDLVHGAFFPTRASYLRHQLSPGNTWTQHLPATSVDQAPAKWHPIDDNLPPQETPEIQRSPTPPSQKLIWGNRSRTRRNLLVHENMGFGLGIYSMYIIYCILLDNISGKTRPTHLQPLQIHQHRSSWWLNQPIWKNMLVKLNHVPNFRDEHQKCLSCHHLVPHFVGRIPPPLQASNSPPRSPLPTEQTVWSGTQLCHASVWVFNQLQAVSLIQANKFESISRGKFHANS